MGCENKGSAVVCPRPGKEMHASKLVRYDISKVGSYRLPKLFTLFLTLFCRFGLPRPRANISIIAHDAIILTPLSPPTPARPPNQRLLFLFFCEITAARIQQSTSVKRKDIRKFLDGIYVSEKLNIEGPSES